MINLPIKRISKDIDMPSYSHQGDAAFDLRAAEEKTILPGEKAIISTGLKIAIPRDHVGLIWDRSGLAANHEITTMGGVIDSSYRGEIKVILKNLSKKEFKINKNDRIAQMIIQLTIRANLEDVESLEETERNEKGFGSTGVK